MAKIFHGIYLVVFIMSANKPDEYISHNEFHNNNKPVIVSMR